MKYLVALKPLTHNTNLYSYATLVEVDWSKGSIIRELKIPSASFETQHGYMRSFMQGISFSEGLLYVSLWNYIAVIDYNKFEIIDCFSHPLMADLHGLDISGNNIYVCSTAIDALLCFDKNSKSLKWWWRPDDDTGYSKKINLPLASKILLKQGSLFSRVAKKIGAREVCESIVKVKFSFQDFRGSDKNKTGYHVHHLNEVKVKGDKVYVLTKGWNNFKSSTIWKISLEKDGVSDLVGLPGIFSGAHDIVFFGEDIYVTESETESVAKMPNDNEQYKVASGRWRLSDCGYFVRGLCQTSSKDFIVGFTPPRNKKWAYEYCPVLREYGEDFKEIKREMALENIYPSVVGGAVHTIMESPSNG